MNKIEDSNNNQDNVENSISSNNIKFESSLAIGISILADMTRQDIEKIEHYFDFSN